jgi:thymidylate synthase
MKSIHIVEPSLPLAWEQATIACWQQGERHPTEYDKPGDPNSRDVVAMIHVTDPFTEPRIHRAFPGGLEDLERYRAEVLYGVHDHWIDPAAGKWEYTYHQRLRAYDVPGAGLFDQIAAAVTKLRSAPHTRRAQAVTWQVWNDPKVADPPCLQRLWFRVSAGGSTGLTAGGSTGLTAGRLDMTAHIRSNDAFKAAFMNMYAFTELQRMVADQLGVQPGEYVHIADSFHIYGSYFAEFEGFLQTVATRPVEQRLFTSDFARDVFLDGCDSLLAEADMPEEKKALVRARRAELAKQSG